MIETIDRIGLGVNRLPWHSLAQIGTRTGRLLHSLLLRGLEENHRSELLGPFLMDVFLISEVWVPRLNRLNLLVRLTEVEELLGTHCMWELPDQRSTNELGPMPLKAFLSGR